jgi:hypothetical protein
MDLELQKAVSSLMDFMEKMYLWEIKYDALYKQENGGPEKHGGSATNDLKAIYEKHLTHKKRATGRLSGGASAGFPPEFNPCFETRFSATSKSQKGWNIIELMCLILFIAIISLIVDFISEKYSFGQIFSLLFFGFWVIVYSLSVLVRIFRFFFGKKRNNGQ